MARRRGPVVLGILTVALALRLLFVWRLPPPVLYWDEPHYDYFGKLYAEAWVHIGQPAAFLSALRAAFERTIWKGEVYSATVGLVYALVGAHPRAVFILQAVADTFGCLCVYGIGLALGGGTVGIVALVLATLYEPLIFAAARLQTETLSSALFLGALWAIVSAAPRRGTARHVVAGVLLALGMLMRQALQYMFPLLLVMVVVVHSDAAWRRRLRLALAFGAGFFLLIGPRLIVTKAVFGHAIWGGVRNPIINAYAGVVLDNVGWQTDHFGFAVPPRDELLSVLEARGVSTPTDEDFRKATLLTVVRHPVESAALVCHKLYQAWAHPYNDSLWQFATGLYAQQFCHKVLLVLGVIGLPLGLRNPRVGVPLLLVSTYLWTMYLAVEIEVRHALPVLPLMLCFAALAAVTLAAGLRTQWRARRMWRLIGPLVASSLLLAALRLAPTGRLLELAPTLRPAVADDLRVATMLGLMVATAGLTFALIRAQLGRGWALAATGPALLLGGAVLLVGRPLATVWHQWSCPLSDERQIAMQEFVVPRDLLAPQKAELWLDLMGPAAADGDLIVSVNGVEVRRFVGGPGQTDAVPAPDFYADIFNAQRLPSRPWRGWYAVPVAPENIVAASKLEVAVRIDGDGTRHPSVKLMGDYLSDGERVYDGPSPFASRSIQDRSLYRYMNTGDWRMRRRTPLEGTSHSRFFDGREWSSTDVSPAPGRQSGRYRILLLLTYAEGTRVF